MTTRPLTIGTIINYTRNPNKPQYKIIDTKEEGYYNKRYMCQSVDPDAQDFGSIYPADESVIRSYPLTFHEPLQLPDNLFTL